MGVWIQLAFNCYKIKGVLNPIRSNKPIFDFKFHLHFSRICTVGWQSKWRFWNRSEGNFTSTNFNSLSRAEKLVFYHKMFFTSSSLSYNMCTKFEGKKIYQKKYIKNLPTCVAMKKNFTAANFNNLLRIEKKKFCHEIFGTEISLC